MVLKCKNNRSMWKHFSSSDHFGSWPKNNVRIFSNAFYLIYFSNAITFDNVKSFYILLLMIIKPSSRVQYSIFERRPLLLSLDTSSQMKENDGSTILGNFVASLTRRLQECLLNVLFRCVKNFIWKVWRILKIIQRKVMS